MCVLGEHKSKNTHTKNTHPRATVVTLVVSYVPMSKQHNQLFDCNHYYGGGSCNLDVIFLWLTCMRYSSGSEAANHEGVRGLASLGSMQPGGVLDHIRCELMFMLTGFLEGKRRKR
jgi:hypothetical protein